MLNLGMFLRQKRNKSGSISGQIISKSRGKYKVFRSLGVGRTEKEIQNLLNLGNQEIERLTLPLRLFESATDTLVEQIFSTLSNSDICTIGPELVFGTIYDSIGFGQLGEELFRHLVIARLVFPLSKLKTVEYLYRYQGVGLDISSVYRFLDKLNKNLKDKVEQITYAHTLKILQGNTGIVFYDMTTLYFEASDEDELRKAGFSKDGKHQNPQIFIGLLVGLGDIQSGMISMREISLKAIH
jgi:hypothetical protein